MESSRGMVVSADGFASAAGIEIMRAGGNAIDAAVATGFALAVTVPRAGNLGGGGFMVIHPADGAAVALDFREVAPAAAHRNMYLDENGAVAPGLSTAGALASGVPGTVAGLVHAWGKYGSGNITWDQVLEPARRLAHDGFPLSADLAQHLRDHREWLASHAESRRIFLRGGDFYQPDERFAQPDLATTLERLQHEGASDFYHGETAALIANSQTRDGGVITLADLGAYRVIERPVLRGTYRGFEFITMPPPSSGGIALQQMLGMLEPYDLRAMGANSADRIHVVIEVMRRAFRDRAEYLGDPDFHAVPQDRLTAPAYIRGLMADFDPDRATPSGELRRGLPTWVESTETTHFGAVDAAGNVVSCTYTLNGNYGSGVTVAGAGFLLNNEMDDFTAKVGVKNMFGLLQSEANAIKPGKRPLSSMTPTIVLRDGRPFLVTGSPGGPSIITTVLQVMLNVIDHDMTLAEAVAAPRLHHQWQPDRITNEAGLATEETLATLEAMGHTFALRKFYALESEAAAPRIGTANSIMVKDSDHFIGVADPRRPSAAAMGF
ncbi:gamma-glutamyltransferase [Synoicihabitans lomoniglobus]|uniref:Glutathione hydrolase proenzyme n=1 Tax=Synoicihabitans lomoniglobus TaxID=2909285 RepID=A0AAF0CQV2_9BACT|nr:gamma-glutamyltransferase [Opitutaceae bacterium LMO-M01]WED66382.1 gamma-glutamyltransferase [Opitutaceae bacterium LMO-M01]